MESRKDIIYCPCGYEIKNDKCSRKKPIKACQGQVGNKRGRFSGKSKSEFAFNEYK